MSIQNLIVLILLSTLGFFTHITPHEMGFSTVGAVSLLAVVYLPWRLCFIPPLVTLSLYDYVHGGYGFAGMSFVYMAHIAATYTVYPILKRIAVTSIAGAAAINAVVFYLISNITPMALSFYPNSIDGWLFCYSNGLPFLLKGLLANLLFAGIVFSVILLSKKLYAHRFVIA